jgi:hypothetical protein
MVGRRLNQNWIFRQYSFCLFVPFCQFYQWFFLFLWHSAIFMKMNSNDLAQGFRKFKKPWDETRWYKIDESCAILSLIGFWNEGEVWILSPDTLSYINIKRIGVICGFWIPVSILFFWINDLSLKNLLMCINKPSILNSA